MAQQKHHNEYDVEDSHHSSHVPGNKKDNRDFRDFRNMSSTSGKFENPEIIFLFSISVYSIKTAKYTNGTKSHLNFDTKFFEFEFCVCNELLNVISNSSSCYMPSVHEYIFF